MLNSKQIQLHAHLWYQDAGVYVLDKLSQTGIDRINLSFVRGNKYNKQLYYYAKSKFRSVKYVKVNNAGNDQVGFFKSLKSNNTEHPWILYCHDKNIKKKDWIDAILNPLLRADKINNLILDGEIGIISSNHHDYFKQIESEEDLIERDKRTPLQEKIHVVLARHTLTWLRELQYVLFKQHGFINKEELNFYFTSGTMFIVRQDIVKIAHSCIHKNFFLNNYRMDGDVEHAMERFYYYVSMCMGYNNKFIGEKDDT